DRSVARRTASAPRVGTIAPGCRAAAPGTRGNALIRPDSITRQPAGDSYQQSNGGSMFDWLASPEAWVALATLTALEMVLGIDNIIFISSLVGSLPPHQRAFARRIGLALAMITRLGLLFSLAWVMGLTTPLFSVLGEAISGRDIILIGGGLFLLAKATHEIHNSLEGVEEQERAAVAPNVLMVLAQI